MIGITIGDPTGIGPEVTLKALANELPHDNEQYLLFGDLSLLNALNRQLGTNLQLEQEQADSRSRIQVYDPIPKQSSAPLICGSRGAAEAAIACLKEAGTRCLQKKLS